MSAFILIVRTFFGLWIFSLGLGHWLSIDPAMGSGPPLAAELAAAFSDTGLLTCASMVMILAGLGCIANRATVVALAAATAILIGGLYWSVLRGDAGLIAMATLSLIVNGALLLAYWPHCRQLFAAITPSPGETGLEESPAWQRAERWSRIIWGGWYIISGLFHFVTGPLTGTEALAVQLMMALLHTGLYEIVKALEAIGGVAVLTRRFAPLLLLINAPITLVVVYWDLLLQDPFGPIGIAVTALTLGTTIILMRAYLPYYIPFLAWRPRHLWQGAPVPSV